MENALAEGTTWPKVAIIILNWNGWRDTIECLESLQKLIYPNYQIVVVDNGSTDDSVARIRRAFPNLSVVETGGNLGYAGGNNIGIRWGLERGAEYVLILNNDTRVEPEMLNVMVEVAKESGADVVGAVVKDASGKKILFSRSRFPDMLLYSERPWYDSRRRWWPTDQVQGSAMLLHRNVLLEREQSVGYFLDESLFLYCEEVELALWCRRFGKKCVVARDAVIYHKAGASSGGKGQPLQFYYLTRNRILLAHRNLGDFYKILFTVVYTFLRTIRATMYLVRGQGEIAQAILQGLLDGLKGKAGPKR